MSLWCLAAIIRSLQQTKHSACGNAGKATLGNHGDQGGLGAFATLEQPVVEVGVLTELGYRDVDRADAGHEVAVAISVALDSLVRAGRPYWPASPVVGVLGQELVIAARWRQVWVR